MTAPGNLPRALAGTEKAMDAGKFADRAASTATNHYTPHERAGGSTTMDTTSHTTTACWGQAPAGIPGGWQSLTDTDGTPVGWSGHVTRGPRLETRACMDTETGEDLNPTYYVQMLHPAEPMTAGELHQFAGQFFEFYRAVCTHLPGVEAPQRLASDQWREV